MPTSRTILAAPPRTATREPRTGRFSAPIAQQVDVVRRLFEAFARRDVDAALALLDRDVRFLPVTAHFAHEGHSYEGHAGIREYVRDVEELWEQIDLIPLEYQAVVGVVVVIGEVRARASSNEFRAPVVWTWRLRDGLIVEGRVHSDLADACAALGVREPRASG